MKHKLNKLENGLRLITVSLPSLDSATIAVWVKTGSRNETDEIAGISHFLEHVVSKGTKKRPSAEKLAEEVDALGAQKNAGTTQDWTNFFIKVGTDKLEPAFDILSDIVINPLLRQKDIEKERGVIIEEMGFYETTPYRRIWDIYQRLMFSGNDLGRDIIGAKKSVLTVNSVDFKRYRNTHYYADKMLLTVAGGISNGKALQLANKYFSNIKGDGKAPAISKFMSRQKKPAISLYPKQIEQAHLVLGFLGRRRGHNNRFKEMLLRTILGNGFSSRMFAEIRRKRGLAYAVNSTTDHFEDTGYFASYAGVAVNKAEEAIKAMLDLYYQLASGKKPVTKGELDKAKGYLKGNLALTLEDTEYINHFFGAQQLFLGKALTPDEVYREIDRVSVDEVNKLAKELFVTDKLNLAIIGPYKSPSRFEKLLI